MDSNSVVVISNESIKNNVTISISHIHSNFNGIKKTIYHTINITLTQSELFAIRCGINQTVQISEAFHIIVITNAIHLVRHIFNSTTYHY